MGGHHVYKTVWTPLLGKCLTVLPETRNSYDKHKVYILVSCGQTFPAACCERIWPHEISGIKSEEIVRYVLWELLQQLHAMCHVQLIRLIKGCGGRLERMCSKVRYVLNKVCLTTSVYSATKELLYADKTAYC